MAGTKKYEFLTKLKRIETNVFKLALSFEFQNERIFFKNGYSISIQCNAFAYCLPRNNYIDIKKYTNFEVACFDQCEQFIILDSSLRGTGEDVIGYLSKGEVEEIYQYLKKIPRRSMLIEKINEGIKKHIYPHNKQYYPNNLFDQI